MRNRYPVAAAVAALLAASPASAQLGSGSGSSALSGLLGGQSGSAGSSGLMGGLLGSSVGATSRSNAAGLLGYCVKNKLLGAGGGVASTLGALTGSGQVTQSKGYAAGEAGQLVTGQGQSLSLDSLKGKVKTKVCDMVLQHAQGMIGR